LWIHFINGAEPAAAEPYGRLFEDVAQRSGDPSNVLVSDRLMGNAMHYSGQQAEARRRFEHVLDHAAAQSAEQNLMWSAHDQFLLSRSRLARVLWLQGFVDQARRAAQASLEDAQSKDHTQAICFVHAEIVCPIALMTGDLATAERSVATLLELAARHGMIYWARFGRCHEGALLIRRGNVVNGSNLLRAALASFRSSRQIVHYLGFIGDFAEGLAAAGRHDEAHAIIDEALAPHDGDGRLWCIAELRRVKGELLLQGAAVGAHQAAETWFDRAMAVAAEQGAPFWEMRAALSLARLRISENRGQDARRLLRPVYDRFTEGLETADLRSARALLL
jgi:tetratricopeptide (TPR) repeat protein